jgi:sn-glycerol 3-phosphate transport system substrate-binding protein
MIRKFFQGALAAAVLAGSSAIAAAQTNLTMYYPIAVGGPLTKVVDGMIEDFQKANPNIKVNAIYAGNYDDTRVRALSAIKSGQPAQLSVLFSIDIYELIEQGHIVPFDDAISSDEERAWLKSFYPALMSNGQVDGKTWGIPFQRSTIVLYYNKDAFKEAGLDPNKPPKTWDEMVKAAKALNKDGRYGIMVPSTGYPYWMFQAFAIQNGIELMNAKGTEVYFDKPATIEALKFWRALAADHKVMPEGTVEWGTLRQAFTQGKTAMMWHTTGNLTAVKNEAKFDFGVAMLPANKRPGSPTGGGNFYLFKGASKDEQKAALTFVRYMTAPEQAAKWSIATGYVGVSAASYQTDTLKSYAKDFPQAVVARDQLEHAVAEFSTNATGRVREALSNAVQAALTGRQTPEAALKAAQEAADRLLKPYR